MLHPSRAEKKDLMTVLLHWALLITLFYSLTSGLRISADNQTAVWARAVSGLLPQGDVIRWHVVAAYALTLIAIAYLMFLVRARLQARVTVDGMRIVNLTAPDRATRWRAINVFLYWLAFILIGIAAVTGGVLYFFSGGGQSFEWVLTLHRACAWMVLVYTVLHVLAQIAFGGLRQLCAIINPRLAYGHAAKAALVFALLAGVSIYAIDSFTIRNLHVARTAEPPLIDGSAADVSWYDTEAVEIVTTRGINQPGSEVTVKVRMLYDAGNIYALFEWPDATRSQKHLPLQKTAGGWRILQKDARNQDEDDYYEDKFAVMLAYSATLAGAGTTHLGPRPLADKPGPAGGRGLHYTTDDSIVDVWHWKSVRTGAIGQLDDNYFGPPLEQDFTQSRYTGGYAKDPGTGGYVMNWKRFSDTIIEPLRLPKNPALLERLGNLDPDPNVSDDGEFWLPLGQTVEYNPALDTYPVGTILPSVLLQGPFEGDRGDVRSAAQWHNGWWRLEVSRKLNTGSPYDVAIGGEAPVYLWVAVFDHAQTRHSMHLHPLQIVLE
jgi:cytochrome b subunit of formate dehydrogenase